MKLVTILPMKSVRLSWGNTAWPWRAQILVSAQPLSTCVTLGKLLNLLVSSSEKVGKMIESNTYGYYENKTHVSVFKGPCYPLYKILLSLILVHMSVYMLYKREQYLFLSQHYVSVMHQCRYIQREGIKFAFLTFLWLFVS